MPMYLEIDVSGVGLRTGLLQTRIGTSCPRDTAPASSTLRLIAVVSKNLSSSEKDITS